MGRQGSVIRSQAEEIERLGRLLAAQDGLVTVCRGIATDHVVGRAFCWVDTGLIVRLRRALGIEPAGRPDIGANYAAEVARRTRPS